MTDTEIIEIAMQTMMVALKLSAPVLTTALVIGFVVSLFQSMTQIQEFTLSFVPKLIAAIAVFAIAGPWMMTTMVEFIRSTILSIPNYAI